MRGNLKIFSTLFLATLLFCSSSTLAPKAEARDLAGRIGVGFIDQFKTSSGRNVPQISAKYGLTKDIGWLGALGFNTAGPPSLVVSSKLFKNIFLEPNLNFYGAVGVGYIRDTRTSVEFLALLGAEFFVPGVESVGMSFEAGASLANASGSFALKSVGFTFLNAGMHFYF